jgi:hypothetical protein
MRPTLLLLAPLTLGIAACDVRTDANGDNVHLSFGSGADAQGNDASDHVSVKVPGFSANVKLAGLDLGRNADIDGVKLAPDTAVKTMDVQGGGWKGDGDVHIAFTNPVGVAKLVDYYRAQLHDADFAITASSGDRIEANKAGKTFVLALSPENAGSHGTITVSRH